MPFATTKTAEQLKTEKDTKNRKYVEKASSYLASVAKKRGLDASVKQRLTELADEAKTLAREAWPQPGDNQQN